MSYDLELATKRAAADLHALARDLRRPRPVDSDPAEEDARIAAKLDAIAKTLEQPLADIERVRARDTQRKNEAAHPLPTSEPLI